MFTQTFIQTQIKENIKAPRHWPLCGEFTGEFPTQRASNAEIVTIWWRHHVKWYLTGANNAKQKPTFLHFDKFTDYQLHMVAYKGHNAAEILIIYLLRGKY